MPKHRAELPEAMVGIGARLRTLRMKRDWSQSELARRAGVDPSQINRIETGERLVGLSASHVVRIAGAFGVSPGFLLTGEEPGIPVTVHDEVPAAVFLELLQEVKSLRAQLKIQEAMGEGEPDDFPRLPPRPKPRRR